MSLERLGRLREGVYRFAGVGFSYPTAELLDAAGSTILVLDDVGLFDYAFALPVVEAAQALAEADLEDLKGAYAALFEAGVGGAACSPHATAYVADPRTGEVARMQAALRAIYRRFGFGDAIGSADMVDHIAAEMEVMARLCADEMRRRAEDDDPTTAVRRQHEFVTGCLEPWIPTFTRRVAAADRHRAYTALASAVHAFIEHERELIPALLSPVGCRS